MCIRDRINIVGNAICIYGLHMGVEGVAIPTLISRVFAAVLMMVLVQHPENVIRVKGLSQLRPEFSMIKKILSVGVPSGLESGMFQFGKLALQSLCLLYTSIWRQTRPHFSNSDRLLAIRPLSRSKWMQMSSWVH